MATYLSPTSIEYGLARDVVGSVARLAGRPVRWNGGLLETFDPAVPSYDGTAEPLTLDPGQCALIREAYSPAGQYPDWPGKGAVIEVAGSMTAQAIRLSSPPAESPEHCGHSEAALDWGLSQVWAALKLPQVLRDRNTHPLIPHPDWARYLYQDLSTWAALGVADELGKIKLDAASRVFPGARASATTEAADALLQTPPDKRFAMIVHMLAAAQPGAENLPLELREQLATQLSSQIDRISQPEQRTNGPPSTNENAMSQARMATRQLTNDIAQEAAYPSVNRGAAAPGRWRTGPAVPTKDPALAPPDRATATRPDLPVAGPRPATGEPRTGKPREI